MSTTEPLKLQSLQYQKFKQDLHRRLLDEVDLESLGLLKEDVARDRLSNEIRALLNQDKAPLTQSERDKLVLELLHEVFGLGPIEPLLSDQTISDILVNGPHDVYIERRGLLEKTDIAFRDEAHLMQIIDRIVSRIGRRIDESSPMVDARLKDGSRVNAIIPPLSLSGPILSIRRFGVDPLTDKDLVHNNSITREMLDLLKASVQGKLNILISGGTGTGKTTLLNVLSSFIPETERIITIEDAAELQLKQEHVISLETRPPNIEGEGAVKQRQLVINSLRMRPDRIVVGEVRGEESIDMLQAMNTGHEGSMTTVHANSPRDALSRLETMISMANLNLPENASRQQIASAIQVVIQITRFPDGTRKVTSISEITGMEGNIVTMQDLYVFERQGYDEQMRARGMFLATGIRPKFSEKLFAAGIQLPDEIFASETFASMNR